MKKLILTSESFSGEVTVHYVENKLASLDFQQAELTDIQIEYMKTKLPVEYIDVSSFLAIMGSRKLQAVEDDVVVSFEQFWNMYGIKRNRLRAERLWEKLSKADKLLAVTKLQKYKHHLQLNTWKTKAEPDTYLKNRYWENEWK